jgi:hypothetical protein
MYVTHRPGRKQATTIAIVSHERRVENGKIQWPKALETNLPEAGLTCPSIN